MINKLIALKNVIELTEHKVGLETVQELIDEATKKHHSKNVLLVWPGYNLELDPSSISTTEETVVVYLNEKPKFF